MGLPLLVFLGVTLTILAGYFLLAGPVLRPRTRVQQRLAEEFSPRSGPETSALFRKIDQVQPPPDLSFDPERPAAPPPRPRWAELRRMLEQEGWPLSVSQFGLLCGCLGLALGVVGLAVGGWLLGVLAATAGVFALPAFLRWRFLTWRARYARQLPSAFELMARVIRAGQSVPQALQAVVEAFEDPLSGEFAECQKQQHLGLRSEGTFQELAERAGILEMRLFAMAMLIQRQTGGSLAEVLERLAGLVRARLRLRQQVRTLTAEGRLQGWTLVVLPFLALGVMLVVNRSYVWVLFEHMSVLVGTLALMVVGMLWIRQIVSLEP